MISPRVYRAFTNVIANDFIATHLQQYQHTNQQTSNQTNNQSSKRSAPHSVARRLGLSTFPLAVLVMTVAIHALTNNHSGYGILSNWPNWSDWSIDGMVDWLIDCFLACLTVEFGLKVTVCVLCVVVGLSMKLILTVAILGHTIQKVQEMESDHANNQTNNQTKQSSEQSTKTNNNESSINPSPVNQSNPVNESTNQSIDLTASPTISPLRTINQSINQSPYLSSPASMIGNRMKKFADLSINLTNVQNPYTPLKQSIHLSNNQPKQQTSTATNQSTRRPIQIPEPVFEHQPYSLLEALQKEQSASQAANQSNQSDSAVNQPSNNQSVNQPHTPQVHAGDVIAVHERVGSVDLLGPSQELGDRLAAIDRYQITQTSIPT